MVLDPQRNLYIADTGNFRIRKVDALTGLITTVAGNGLAGFSGDGSAATLARIDTVKGMAVDYAGNLYFTDVFDASNHRVRIVSMPAGTISTRAGLGTVGSTGDGGIATSARLSSPHSIVVDSGGKVQISDKGNHRIRAVK